MPNPAGARKRHGSGEPARFFYHRIGGADLAASFLGHSAHALGQALTCQLVRMVLTHQAAVSLFDLRSGRVFELSAGDEAATLGPPEYALQTLRNANGLSTMAAMLTAVLSGNPEITRRIREIHSANVDCLPSFGASRKREKMMVPNRH